ncbi:hypothetical protein HZR84_09585 [Hyphobacterium sp. CCMP332]|nr:hypothetical protein HZR84_09585 [Hyphobacterium sp. CCMP332]
MDKQIAKLNKIAGGLCKSLEIPDDIQEILNVKSKTDFHKALAKLIEGMIENDFERFLSVMYRMDVSELKLKEILNNADAEQVYIKIAELVIKREEEKIFWREKYKS